MANVSIKFNNKDYILSCDDGQEESLKKLTEYLNKKYVKLEKKLGNLGENKLLLITSIEVIDEFFEVKKKIYEQKNKIDLLSKKFLELKSLAIKFKDNKEIEIEKLNSDINKFKKTIEKNNQSYELMLDKATKSLEKIIKNAGSTNNIQ